MMAQSKQHIISVSVNPQHHRELMSCIDYMMANKGISKAKACRILMLKGWEKIMENPQVLVDLKVYDQEDSQ
jgi:hypothetical protein